MVPISDRTHHSALRPERAGVQEVVALSRHEGEVKPLEQLGHHHFSLHLQTPIVLIPCVTFTHICVMLFLTTVATHLSKVLSQAWAWTEGKGVVAVIRPCKKGQESYYTALSMVSSHVKSKRCVYSVHYLLGSIRVKSVRIKFQRVFEEFVHSSTRVAAKLHFRMIWWTRWYQVYCISILSIVLFVYIVLTHTIPPLQVQTGSEVRDSLCLWLLRERGCRQRRCLVGAHGMCPELWGKSSESLLAPGGMWQWTNRDLIN